ncbi:hypothetical protein PV08_09275 [Exophiala spinifera]|uniref:F-box domain-containing protein n=1 Tax=Exophiala spinifera TaxID=91928 RepID=A0A0D1YAT4_9EURO|nr:uncharacterized protein PV08_09275 [Exophiala spinifera]KIW12001.1 hypothetical protein PV08_09275 [Exophiala spinifera]
MLLSDLPQDVLSLIVSHLAPKDYLAFSQVSKAIYSEYRQDSLYWRTQTSNTFRLPISPLLAADGPRWYWLYKRLKTQTQLYTWGQGVKGNLGLGRALPNPHPRPPLLGPNPPRTVIRGPHRPFPRQLPRPVPRQSFHRTSSSWPTETHIPDEVGVIADLQCGGWSTTILSSKGRLYTVGIIDSLNGIPVGHATNDFTPLEYLTQSTSAVRQFSSGRRHILALTDDGEILSWDRINAKGLKVFPTSGRDFGGKPVRVSAGWGESSAYVPEVGIIFWDPVRNNQRDEMEDSVHVKVKLIPGTARKRTNNGPVEVIKHILLTDFVVWITSDSRIYACDMHVESPEQDAPTRTPFEVPGFSGPERELKDIQGQFQRFGVFTASGEVVSGDVEYLKRCAEAAANQAGLIESGDWSTLTSLLASKPRDIPALQHTGVIGLAYGDYHYHALHANGKITSYGTDSQQCGSLGLGNLQEGASFRGLFRKQPGLRADACLIPTAYLTGRQLWFEPERKDWLKWLEEKSQHESVALRSQERPEDPTSNESPQPIAHILDAKARAAFSEWVEQEGRHWEDGPVSRSSPATSEDKARKQASGDYVSLGAYFPIAVAAAGWHSGALVLKDDEKAHEIRNLWVVPKSHDEHDDQTQSMPGAFQHLNVDEEEYVWQKDGFPRVRLPDGTDLSGSGEESPWRDGMPPMQDLGLSQDGSPESWVREWS